MSFRDNPIGGATNKIVNNFTTNGDLTSAQYKVAKIYDSLTIGLASATTDLLAGIIENIPLSGTGQSIRIVTAGLTKAVAAGALTAGAVLTTDANGHVAALATTTAVRIGYAYTSASAASELISILVNINNAKLPA